MRGSIITIPPSGEPVLREYDRPVELHELKAAIGGGYLEVVPYFNSISYGGTVMDCVAFCDEDGKRGHLPLNEPATKAWERALVRRGMALRTPQGEFKDWLVGSIAVVFGDREFMAEL